MIVVVRVVRGRTYAKMIYCFGYHIPVLLLIKYFENRYRSFQGETHTRHPFISFLHFKSPFMTTIFNWPLAIKMWLLKFATVFLENIFPSFVQNLPNVFLQNFLLNCHLFVFFPKKSIIFCLQFRTSTFLFLLKVYYLFTNFEINHIS